MYLRPVYGVNYIKLYQLILQEEIMNCIMLCLIKLVLESEIANYIRWSVCTDFTLEHTTNAPRGNGGVVLPCL